MSLKDRKTKLPNTIKGKDYTVFIGLINRYYISEQGSLEPMIGIDDSDRAFKLPLEQI